MKSEALDDKSWKTESLLKTNEPDIDDPEEVDVKPPLLAPPPLLTATHLRAREHDTRVLVLAALRVGGEGEDCTLLLVGLDGLHLLLLRPFRGD